MFIEKDLTESNLKPVFMYLLQDEFSAAKKGKIYGKKGDKVKVVSKGETVSIVEIIANNGFAVENKHLSNTKPK